MFGDGYLYGRAHGIIGKVLTTNQINFLLTSSNLKELQASFRQTQYGPIVQNANFVTEMPKVARLLKEYFANIVSTFYVQGSQRAKEKIDLYSQKFHAENIRYILRGLYMGQSQEEILGSIFPIAKYSYSFYEKILHSTSISEIIKKQTNSSFKIFLKQAYFEFEKTGRFVPLDSAIDQYEYSILPEISTEYKTYVNLKNILWVCRCIDLGILPYRYIKPTKFITKALDATSVSEILSMYNFGVYRKIFSLDTTGQVTATTDLAGDKSNYKNFY